MTTKGVSLDAETTDLVRAAFEKSWQFVKNDPELAHNSRDEMRSRLSRHLTRLAQSGERDLWRLANSAIGRLRRDEAQPSVIDSPR